MNREAKTGLWLFAGLLTIVAASSLLVVYVFSRGKDAGLREVAYVNDLVTAAVDADSYDGLTFTEADGQNPAYLRLRGKLIKIEGTLKDTYPIRGSYIMKVMGDEILFVSDAVPEDDAFHAVPGTPYERPPQDLLDTVRDGVTRTAGPYTDEYGTHYSVFARQSDDSGTPVAYVATDIEKSALDHKAWEGARPAVLAGLCAALAYLVLFFVLERLFYMRRQRRESELEKVRLASEREKMLMNIGEGVVAFDGAGRTVFANKFAIDSVCQGDADCAAKDDVTRWALLDEVGAPLPPEFSVDAGALIPLTGGRIRRPHLRRADGSLFPVAVSTVALELGPGSPALVMTFSDVTREAEVDKMKSDFIDIAVHQLKTPITALKWSVEMLSEAATISEHTANDEQTIRDIVEVTERLSGLVTMLLDVTRIESGRLAVNPKLVDVGQLAADAVRENAAAAQAKRQTVALNVASGLPQVSVDRGLILEAMRNLLTNAIKYSAAGSDIEVDVEKDGYDIAVSVRDYGIGIPVADQKRVFGKFFRARNAVDSSEDGTGLGLYFANQIIEVSGGRLRFESKEGVGTTFRFTLPLTGSQPHSGSARLG